MLSCDNDSQCGARNVSPIASNSRSFCRRGGIGGLTRTPLTRCSGGIHRSWRVWRNIKNYWLPGTAGPRVMTHILIVGDNLVLCTGKHSKMMACKLKGLKSHLSLSIVTAIKTPCLNRDSDKNTMDTFSPIFRCWVTRRCDVTPRDGADRNYWLSPLADEKSYNKRIICSTGNVLQRL